MAQDNQQNLQNLKTCQNCGSVNPIDNLSCQRCRQVLGTQKGVILATLGQRVIAFILDIILMPLTLFIGYIIWWLFTLRHGQTPGKQLAGIRAIMVDGRPAGWLDTFLREFLFKYLLFSALSAMTASILGWLDYLWAFGDKNRQTLHDKLAKTLVVERKIVVQSIP